MFSLVLVLTNYKHVWNNCSELDNHNHMAQCNLFNVVNNIILKISRWWFVISRCCFLILKTFAYQPRFTREISKFQKSELGKFIPNFPLKHVITSTNLMLPFLVIFDRCVAKLSLLSVVTPSTFSCLLFLRVISTHQVSLKLIINTY